MKYVQFLRGNSTNFRTMYGLSQQFDACTYKGRHGVLWYNPSNVNECYVAIEYVDDTKGFVIDILKDNALTPQIEIVNSNPIVCEVKNHHEISNRVENIVKFIYDMDNGRMEK